MNRKYLLDVNIAVALTSDEHEHYDKAHSWFDALTDDVWALCPLTEAGYMRLAANPALHLGPGNIPEAAEVLVELAEHAGYRYLQITGTWAELTMPFADRIFGHQQVTDAYLLGLAIKEDGVLVTFDKAIQYMAGPEFSRNLLVLE